MATALFFGLTFGKKVDEKAGNAAMVVALWCWIFDAVILFAVLR